MFWHFYLYLFQSVLLEILNTNLGRGPNGSYPKVIKLQ